MTYKPNSPVNSSNKTKWRISLIAQLIVQIKGPKYNYYFGKFSSIRKINTIR